MRVAALNDIHGNLPALEAVLEEVRRANVDQIVVGGDVVPGPMARESLERLLALDRPVQFIHGNCELAALAQMAARESGSVSYWGTTSGNPLPPRDRENIEWTARHLAEYRPLFASWPKTLRLDVEGLGSVLFCHGTPRSETEIFTRLTAEERLVPLFESLDAAVVVCGHTHMQFDRKVGRTRVVNAGSVGMPFGASGAHWALLGPGTELRQTSYDLIEAAERMRKSEYPGAQDYARDLLEPADESEILETFEKAAVR
jgi:predicted phosphodiesterase